MLTWTESYIKMQRLAKDANADTLTQLQQDWNTGYHLFNAKLARYYTRKQQFTNLIANQDIYQTPIDSIRILGMTVLVTSAYEPPVYEVSSEESWRNLKSVKTLATSWPTNYFVLGNDEIQLYPTPSQSITNGIRYYYQPQDHDLSIDDTVSTGSDTVTLVNGSNVVTAAASAFNVNMVGQMFQPTGVIDLTWYEITAVPNATTLNLKSNYVGPSNSGVAWHVGQVSIIPQEYQDAPMHYALGNYFMAQGNEARAQYHLGDEEKPGMYFSLVAQCMQDYSSSDESGVITDAVMALNPWQVPPQPA